MSAGSSGVSYPLLPLGVLTPWDSIWFVACALDDLTDDTLAQVPRLTTATAQPHRTREGHATSSEAEVERAPPPRLWNRPLDNGPLFHPDWLGEKERAIYQSQTFSLRAREWLAGRWLSKALVKTVHGREPETIEVLPEHTNAPALHRRGDGERLPGLFLSISHTRDYAAAAISPQPVGIDLSELEDGQRLRRIARRVLSPGEAEDTRAFDTAENGATVWALKEAALKLDQGGIFSPGARAIRVEMIHPVRLRNPGIEAAVWRLPQGMLALARHG